MSDSVKNVAIINAVCYGSTGKIAVGLHEYMQSKNINSYLCYGRGKGKADSSYYKMKCTVEVYVHFLLARLFGAQGCYSWVATFMLIHFLKKKNVDTIYAVLLHGYYLNEKMLFDFASRNKIRVVYLLVDEYPFVGKCTFTGGCKQYLDGCGHCPIVKDYPKSLFFDRSRYLFKRKDATYSQLKRAAFVAPEFVIQQAKKSSLTRNLKLCVLDEAVNLQMFYPREVSRLKHTLGISQDQIVLVCIAPYNGKSKGEGRKGVIYFEELAKRFELDKQYAFVQVGYKGDLSDLPSNYIAKGYISDENELAEYFSLGDLFIFPSLEDTMSNACLDALGCGTPLLCFNVSGMPYLADETTATFVEARDVDAMERVVKSTQKKDALVINRCREYAIKRYDAQNYNSKLLTIAESI